MSGGNSASKPLRDKGSTKRGFTIIELLVVIAIILILVAIALPNFMESVTRAKVVKANGDLKAIRTGLEAYFLDWGAYPAESEAEYDQVGRFDAGLTWLTTPAAYLGQLPHDPFQGASPHAISYELGGVEIPFEERPGGLLAAWVLHSYGPDSPEEENHTSRPNYKLFGDQRVNSFSPTNGTKSRGDISIYGGDPAYIGVVLDFADRRALESAEKPGLWVDGEVYLGRLPRTPLN